MSVKRNLAVDAVVLSAYLVAANPGFTGVGTHEWIGMGLFAVFLVHAALHFDWVVKTVRGLRDASWGIRGNLALDALALVVFAIVVVSGLGISGDLLQTFGLYADGYYFWNPLHSMSAKALFAILLVHVAVHWKWVRAAAGKTGSGASDVPIGGSCEVERADR